MEREPLMFVALLILAILSLGIIVGTAFFRRSNPLMLYDPLKNNSTHSE